MYCLRHRGFTLIELLIAIAVVAILASVAYPSYMGAQVKNRRAVAKVFLSDVAQRQQQFLMDNRRYAVDLTELSSAVPADVSAYYRVDIEPVAGTPPSYQVIATPLAGSSQVSDGALSLAGNGTKQPPEKW